MVNRLGISGISSGKRLGAGLVLGLAGALAGGCASMAGSGSGGAPAVSEVGEYPPPSRAIALAENKPALVIPPFAVTAEDVPDGLGAQAADELVTLMGRTERFNMNRRDAFDDALASPPADDAAADDDDDHAEAAADDDGADTESKAASDAPDARDAALAAARAAKADYVGMGRVLRFRVQPVLNQGWLQNTMNKVTSKVYDPTSATSPVSVEVRVELKVLRADSGQPREVQTQSFERTATARDLGIELDGWVDDTRQDDLALTPESRAKLVRYALDRLVKEMLPNLDQLVLTWTFENDF